jgi:hypothetical protein
MKRLSPADALQFAIHCLTCSQCTAAAEEATSFVGSARGAARQVRADHKGLRLQFHASPIRVAPMARGCFCAQIRFHAKAEDTSRTGH